MITCTECGNPKDDDDFAFRNKAKGIRQKRCRECFAAYEKDWYERNASRHKTMVIANNVRYKKRNTAWVNQLKASLRCAVCGEDDVACLDFHHRDPHQKDMSIARAIQHAWSLARLQREIDKCDVLCANHHRKRHAELRLTDPLAGFEPSNDLV